MCKLHSPVGGALKLQDVLIRAGLETTKNQTQALAHKRVIYSKHEIVSAKKVLERIAAATARSASTGESDSTSIAPRDITI